MSALDFEEGQPIHYVGVGVLQPKLNRPRIDELCDERVEKPCLPTRIVVLLDEDAHLVFERVPERSMRKVVKETDHPDHRREALDPVGEIRRGDRLELPIATGRACIVARVREAPVGVVSEPVFEPRRHALGDFGDAK